MKQFKKIFSLIIAVLIFLFSFAACSAESAQNTSSAESDETGTLEVSVTEEITTISDINVAPVSKKIIVGTTDPYPPFVYPENSDDAGFDIEVASGISEYLGMIPEYHYTDFNSLIMGLENGQYDMALAAIPDDRDISGNIEFSSPYAEGRHAILTVSGSSVKSLEDITDNTIGVITGRHSESFCKETFPDAKMAEYPSLPDVLAALDAGEVDALIADEAVASIYGTISDSYAMIKLDNSSYKYVVAVTRGNSELLTAINEAIYVLKDNGLIDKAAGKYIS